MKTPYIVYPLFFKFWSLPPPTLLSTTPTLTALSAVLFLWLHGWPPDIWCVILLNDIMDLHMLSLVTLVPEGPWYVFYATRHQVYWGLTHNVAFCCYSTLIWYQAHTSTHTHTHTHTHTCTQGPVDWHSHINIYLCHLLCAHSSYLYYIEWIIHRCQEFTFHNVFFFPKKYSLVEVIYLLIRCCKTRFFLWNTNKTDRNGVNKQNIHIITQRKITLERVS